MISVPNFNKTAHVRLALRLRLHDTCAPCALSNYVSNYTNASRSSHFYSILFCTDERNFASFSSPHPQKKRKGIDMKDSWLSWYDICAKAIEGDMK